MKVIGQPQKITSVLDGAPSYAEAAVKYNDYHYIFRGEE